MLTPMARLHPAPDSAADSAAAQDRSAQAGAAATPRHGMADLGQSTSAPLRDAADRAAADADAGVNAWWASFFRWGPYALLGLGTGLAGASAGQLMTPGQVYAAAALAPVAFLLQLVWQRRGGTPVAPGRCGRYYYAARLLLAFVLTWLNPFFAIYALMGYFDGPRLLRGRALWAGLLGTAVIMAGSQAGGLPPADATGWVAWAALFALNGSLAVIFGRLGVHEAHAAQVRSDTIEELARTNAALEQALAENAGLHAQLLVQAREAGAQDERSRLAAEIHDTLAQGLAGIVTQLQAAEDAADAGAARAHLDRAATLARQNLGEARRSVHNLGPVALEHDALPEALRKLVATATPGGLAAPGEFTVTGTVEPLHDEIEATLLRIAQEALANAVRHADATRIGVTLSYMGDEVSLDVRDDGRGFDPAAPPQAGTGAAAGGGFGLRGMRARAERVAGTLDVESEPGHGTAVSARVPLVRHG